MRTRVCKSCGKKLWDHQFLVSPLMEWANENGVCLECAQWLKMRDNPPKNLQIIDGIAYSFNKVAKKRIGTYLGSSGNMKYIYTKNKDILASNDVWMIGVVPDSFKSVFSDTAWWITEKAALKILKNNMVCQDRSCNDRYHCLRYCYEAENKKGAYNVIPNDWITGDEHCRYFINIFNVQRYAGTFDPSDPTLYET